MTSQDRKSLMGTDLLDPRLVRNIEDAIAGSAIAWDTFVESNLGFPTSSGSGLPLAVKYVSTRWAHSYARQWRGQLTLGPSSPLFIGDSHYTWGIGTYVTGISEPVSTAIYGRAGVVAEFDPDGWRVFDARDPALVHLYLLWLQAQVNYADAVMTVHTDHFLHGLRNLFRQQFRIDVVMFRPDERDINQWYTRDLDTWLAVSDWLPDSYTLKVGASERFSRATLTILAEEDFGADEPALTRHPYLDLELLVPNSLVTANDVRLAYAAGEILRVRS